MITHFRASKDFSEADDAYAKRRKKKLYYAKLKQQEEERQKELASKYRDRVRLILKSFYAGNLCFTWFQIQNFIL